MSLVGRLLTEKNRHFQLWSYSVSLRRLLLRSTKEDHPEIGSRIDVLFQAVTTVKLQTSFDGLIVDELHGQRLDEAIESNGLVMPPKDHFFQVASSSDHGYVVAGVMVSAQDDLEFNAPSELWPNWPPSADTP